MSWLTASSWRVSGEEVQNIWGLISHSGRTRIFGSHFTFFSHADGMQLIGTVSLFATSVMVRTLEFLSLQGLFSDLRVTAELLQPVWFTACGILLVFLPCLHHPSISPNLFTLKGHDGAEAEPVVVSAVLSFAKCASSKVKVFSSSLTSLFGVELKIAARWLWCQLQQQPRTTCYQKALETHFLLHL